MSEKNFILTKNEIKKQYDYLVKIKDFTIKTISEREILALENLMYDFKYKFKAKVCTEKLSVFKIDSSRFKKIIKNEESEDKLFEFCIKKINNILIRLNDLVKTFTGNLGKIEENLDLNKKDLNKSNINKSFLKNMTTFNFNSTSTNFNFPDNDILDLDLKNKGNNNIKINKLIVKNTFYKNSTNINLLTISSDLVSNTNPSSNTNPIKKVVIESNANVKDNSKKILNKRSLTITSNKTFKSDDTFSNDTNENDENNKDKNRNIDYLSIKEYKNQNKNKNKFKINENKITILSKYEGNNISFINDMKDNFKRTNTNLIQVENLSEIIEDGFSPIKFFSKKRIEENENEKENENKNENENKKNIKGIKRSLNFNSIKEKNKNNNNNKRENKTYSSFYKYNQIDNNDDKENENNNIDNDNYYQKLTKLDFYIKANKINSLNIKKDNHDNNNDNISNNNDKIISSKSNYKFINNKSIRENLSSFEYPIETKLNKNKLNLINYDNNNNKINFNINYIDYNTNLFPTVINYRLKGKQLSDSLIKNVNTKASISSYNPNKLMSSSSFNYNKNIKNQEIEDTLKATKLECFMNTQSNNNNNNMYKKISQSESYNKSFPRVQLHSNYLKSINGFNSSTEEDKNLNLINADNVNAYKNKEIRKFMDKSTKLFKNKNDKFLANFKK